MKIQPAVVPLVFLALASCQAPRPVTPALHPGDDATIRQYAEDLVRQETPRTLELQAEYERETPRAELVELMQPASLVDPAARARLRQLVARYDEHLGKRSRDDAAREARVRQHLVDKVREIDPEGLSDTLGRYDLKVAERRGRNESLLQLERESLQVILAIAAEVEASPGASVDEEGDLVLDGDERIDRYNALVERLQAIGAQEERMIKDIMDRKAAARQSLREQGVNGAGAPER